MAKTAIDKLLEEVKLKKGTPKSGYVSVVPSPIHAKHMENWAKNICRIKFSVPRKEMHCTLMYDVRNKVATTNTKKPLKGRLFMAEPINVALLGKKNDYLVLELHSPDLERRHEKLKSYGFRHSYKKFLPHVTIKEKAVKSDFVSAAANLYYLLEVLPEMVFYGENWSEVED